MDVKGYNDANALFVLVVSRRGQRDEAYVQRFVY